MLNINDVAAVDNVSASEACDSGDEALIAHLRANHPNMNIVSAESRSVQEIHAPGEFFYEPMGLKLLYKGWSTFPQTRGERRGPGVVDGHALRWKPYAERLPTERDVRWWGIQCPKHNVAAILGKASGNTFALDLDISDIELSRLVRDLADAHLGVTDFSRTGRYPRVALIYRYPEGAPIRSRSYRFVEGEAVDGVPTDFGGLEILSHSKPITVYGNHHKTGRYFRWGEKQPLYSSPEDAPEVTQEQIDSFLDAVQVLRPFTRSGRVLDLDTRWAFDAATGLSAPRALNFGDWAVDDDGRVVDGRVEFLFQLTRSVVRANENAARGGDAGMQALCALVEERFVSLAIVEGRWTQDLRREVAAAVARCVAYALEQASQGKRHFRAPTSIDAETGVATFAEDAGVEVIAEKAPDLDWAKDAVAAAATEKGSKRLPQMAVIPATAESKAAAALMPREDRFVAGQEVSRQVRDYVRGAFAYAYDQKERGGWKPASPEDKMPLFALVAPTGAGKTVAAVKEAIAIKAARPGVTVCAAIIVPSHANASEIAAVAERERETEDAVALARAAGLRVLHFKGRITAGCAYGQQMSAVYAAGMPGNRLCRTNDRNMFGEREEKLCPLYESCAYRRQLAALAAGEVDLVLLPHSTLTGPLPKELTDAVDFRVIDESSWRAFVGVLDFPLAALSQARPEPKLLKIERKTGVNPQQFIRDRDVAVETLLQARAAGQDPALAFHALALRNGLPGGWHDHGVEILQSARRCASDSRHSGAAIRPDMTMEEVAKAVDVAQSEHAEAEAALWSVILDRLQGLIAQRDAEASVNAVITVGGQAKAPTSKPKGTRDRRVQFLTAPDGTESVRVSWRRKQNFSHVPTLLIDASLSEKITRKLFPDRAIDVRRVAAPMHLRTILVADGTGSDAAVLPGRTAARSMRKAATARLDLVLAGASRMEGLYANSGVLLSSTQAVRLAAERFRTSGPNASYLHQGNSRGFDFAKAYGALYSYGRLEAPPRVIDGYAAAFTFDDDEPEAPWDLHGNGTAPDGKSPLKPPSGTRRILMRDGTYREYADYLYAEGTWAREVQNQMREEELRQTVGRLRPVFRVDSDATWINVSRCVPEGIVVDEIVSLIDIARPGGKADHIFEAARRSHGVMCPMGAMREHPDLVTARPGSGEPNPVLGLSDREREGVVTVRYRNASGHVVEKAMLNSVEDLEGALLDYLATTGGSFMPGSFEIVGERPARMPIAHKVPDRVDRERSFIPWDAQESILAEVDGPRLLREALLRERMANEAAARAASLALVKAELGRMPTDWLSLPAMPGVPRSEMKVRLSERVILDAAEAEAGGTANDGRGDED